MILAGLRDSLPDPCVAAMNDPNNPDYAVCQAIAVNGSAPAAASSDATPDLGDLMPCPDGTVVSASTGCPSDTPGYMTCSNGFLVPVGTPCPSYSSGPSNRGMPKWLWAVGAVAFVGLGAFAVYYHKTHAQPHAS